jgi:hypothetical protein
MAGQFGHLPAAISLPTVSPGVIPFAAPRRMWPLEARYIYDGQVVQVELLTADVAFRAPTEVATHVKGCTELCRSAVFGAQARRFITSAIDALD